MRYYCGVIAVSCLLLGLSSCGQKGPLYLPPEPSEKALVKQGLPVSSATQQSNN